VRPYIQRLNIRSKAVRLTFVDVDKLRGSPVGRLVEIHGTDPRTMRDYHHFAYVPEPLPDLLVLSQRTWTAVSEAAGALGQLKQVCAQLPNPQILITPALAKEAVATSALEGTYGALADVLEARLPGFEPRTAEVREIHSYERMAQLGFDSIKERGLTIGLLCDLQKILAEGSRRPAPEPGRVRTQPVIIGPEDCTVYDARFIPPPPGDLLEAGLADWQTWIGKDHDLPVVVRAALAHYQFETLHPFRDCNGRVGRLVTLLQFMQAGALDAPSLTISPWLLRRRDEYQSHLLEVSRTGDWNPWIVFFCHALREQCESHVDVAKQLLDWLDTARHRLHERRWTGLIFQLTEQLVDWPIVSSSWVQAAHGVTAPTAQSAISRLEEIGVLKELTGGNYRRMYGATEVMRLVESL
jgi:cell filamentation protein, protein adenylyltransferase